MPRVNVWVPAELHEAAAALPGVNWSAAIQAGLRQLLDCDHEHLACTACGQEARATDVASEALDGFYRRLVAELDLVVHRFGTAEGAARVARKVALAHGIAHAADRPLPRVSKTARAEQAAATPLPLPTEAAARHRHPTNHQENTA